LPRLDSHAGCKGSNRIPPSTAGAYSKQQ
jgi:hypothetical protein